MCYQRNKSQSCVFQGKLHIGKPVGCTCHYRAPKRYHLLEGKKKFQNISELNFHLCSFFPWGSCLFAVCVHYIQCLCSKEFFLLNETAATLIKMQISVLSSLVGIHFIFLHYCCFLTIICVLIVWVLNVSDGKDVCMATWFWESWLWKRTVFFVENVLYVYMCVCACVFLYVHIYFLHCTFIFPMFCRSVVKLRNFFLSAMVQFELHGSYQLHKSVSIFLNGSLKKVNYV